MSINTDAPIEQVGIAGDGSMDVPALPSNAGWYKFGPRPGEIGSAVIAGHVNDKYGDRAVFSDLRKLKAGDRVVMQDGQGIPTSFVVRSSREYDSKADTKEVFISDDGLSHLNLITCIGAWDKSINSYSKRLVVFTDKEIE